MAHLGIQAQARGLSTHQFRAFDLEALTEEMRPRPGWAIVSVIAVGTAADEPPAVRERRSTADLRAAPWSTPTPTP
ncbi:hypothetical protein [Streptomyces sp. C]|uniref:hypothetical protein n=1 Tax=Streptomyces sp. C TaxID=253839 RepID=UPI0001B572E3|nr:hypothetical protein [Streptomyces sp. C]EFL19303.1 predicted protein [Streptomyces sp. C]